MNGLQVSITTRRELLLAAILAVLVSTRGCLADSVYTALNQTAPFTASNVFANPEALFITGLWTTPSLTGNDTFRGWVTFTGGITIDDGSTLELETFGGIGGVLTFGGASARLKLARDLFCLSTFSINSSGGPGGKILATSPRRVIHLKSGLTLSSPLTIEAGGDVIIDGAGNQLTLACASAFDIKAGAHLVLRNMELVVSDAAALTSLDGGGYLTLSNVIVRLGTDVSVGNGVTTTIRGRVTVQGSGKSLTMNNLTSTTSISDYSTLTIGQGVTFAATSNLVLSASSSTLALDGCVFDISGDGLTLTQGALTFANKVLVKAPSKTLELGDGTLDGEVEIRLLGDAYVMVDGAFYHHPS